jgi:UDP-galactopyranose mutase
LSQRPDLVCFSHLRWDFVYQRPNHLMARAAQDRRVFYVEESVRVDDGVPRLVTRQRLERLTVVVPEIPNAVPEADETVVVRRLLDEFFEREAVERPVVWYYTPAARPLGRHLTPLVTVYDCMDELSAFEGAPADLLRMERDLMAAADIVFTGGYSLYEAKRRLHPKVLPFPSSVDARHFGAAREPQRDPADQAGIPHPRLGYFGVIDERMDFDLVAGLAARRPDWQIVMLGPVVKVDPSVLPQAPNIHYLGMKDYTQLPTYLSGWDVGLMPFARNAATRFISPTKTPEYLAAGRPVVSTSIRDVVRTYGERDLVLIADTVSDMERAAMTLLAERADGRGSERQRRADAMLSEISWDRTWSRMSQHLDRLIDERRNPRSRPAVAAGHAIQVLPSAPSRTPAAGSAMARRRAGAAATPTALTSSGGGSGAPRRAVAGGTSGDAA